MQERITGMFGEHIAKIKFNEPAQDLQVKRTVSTFSIEIPITIEFGTMPTQLARLHPYLNNLWGEVYVSVEPNNNRVVGKIQQLGFKHAHKPGDSVVSKIIWVGNLSELSFFEKVRDGSQPKIQLSAHGELYYLTEMESNTSPQMRSGSWNFWLNAYIELSKDIWIDRLRKINCLENILIEIPLPTLPASPWDQVWAALTEARDAFEQGGSTA